MIQRFGRKIEFFIVVIGCFCFSVPFYDSTSHTSSLVFTQFRLDVQAEPSTRMVDFLSLFSSFPLLSFPFFLLDMRSHISQAGHQVTKWQMMTLNFCLDSFRLHLSDSGITFVHLVFAVLGINPGHARHVFH